MTYHPHLPTLLRVLEALSGQVADGVIVDNGSPQYLQDRLAAECCKRGLSLLPIGQNIGIAAAHNRGIGWAADRQGDFVLLLDQDSVAEVDMVERLLSAHMALAGAGIRVAAVGPSYRTTAGGYAPVFVRFGLCKFRRVSRPSAGMGWAAVDFLISSGCLIALPTLRDVGEMDEALFIDHVDTEWFLRARQKGYVAYGVFEAGMEHSLGEGCSRVWLGRWRQLPRHKPQRYYYIFRNSLLLYRRPYAPRQWIRNDLVRLLVIGFCFILLRPPRLQNAIQIGRGVFDGWQGRGGPATGAG